MTTRTSINGNGEIVTRHLCTVRGCGWPVDEAGALCPWHEDREPVEEVEEVDYSTSAIRALAETAGVRTWHAISDVSDPSHRAAGWKLLCVTPRDQQEVATLLAEAGYHVVDAPLLTIPANPWNPEPRILPSHAIHLFTR